MERAAQFMPFAPLKGYYELIMERCREDSPRRELSEDDMAVLNDRLGSLSKGDIIRLTYYDQQGYVTEIGTFRRKDDVEELFYFGARPIAYGDLYAIEPLGEDSLDE